MAQATAKLARPKYTGLMAGWCVFLGIYQILLAARFGGLFLGSSNLLTQDLSSPDLRIVQTVIGIVAFIVAYGLWGMRWWGWVLGCLLMGALTAVALTGLLSYFLGGNTSAPIVWDVLDLAFVAFNLSWGIPRTVCDAYMCQPSLKAR